MLTLGIDLSANPKKTGVAVLEWAADSARVVSLDVGGHDDAALCVAIRNADKAGIDCPLGWPTPFIDYLIAHRAGGHDLVVPATRSTLAYRSTDLYVKASIGVQGLSVAADRIGAAAMRCAALLASLTLAGQAVDRSGSGLVVEVYPAAALKCWGLPHQGYKGKATDNVQRRAELTMRLVDTAEWLDLSGQEAACVASDDALDAVLCAVIAGFSARGACEPVPDDLLPTAQEEGWIAVPSSPLSTAPADSNPKREHP